MSVLQSRRVSLVPDECSKFGHKRGRDSTPKSNLRKYLYKPVDIDVLLSSLMNLDLLTKNNINNTTSVMWAAQVDSGVNREWSPAEPDTEDEAGGLRWFQLADCKQWKEKTINKITIVPMKAHGTTNEQLLAPRPEMTAKSYREEGRQTPGKTGTDLQMWI